MEIKIVIERARRVAFSALRPQELPNFAVRVGEIDAAVGVGRRRVGKVCRVTRKRATCKVFVVNGKDVTLVKGETFNIKVTYQYDLRLAETLLGGEE